jgi:hypothetical protein
MYIGAHEMTAGAPYRLGEVKVTVMVKVMTDAVETTAAPYRFTLKPSPSPSPSPSP